MGGLSFLPAEPWLTVAAAARLIRNGRPVAMPTETVYGLAADATSAEAVARVYEMKRRPSFNPLIIHVDDPAMADRIAVLAGAARRLAERFWPGPLTLVLPRAEGSPVAALATAGLATVAVRMPAHPVARALIAAAGVPLAAPSANRSGTLSPTRPDHVRRTLDVPVLDGGDCTAGLESTIAAIADDAIRLLRAGPITAAELAAATGLSVSGGGDGAITAPGQLAAHYAPGKPLRLEAVAARPGEWLIGFGPVAGDATLSVTGDLVEAAARLFALLHEADAGRASAIAVAPVPETGLGAAINDRLRRAAAGSG